MHEPTCDRSHGAAGQLLLRSSTKLGSGISIVPPTYKTSPADLTTTGASTGPTHSNDKSHPTNALSKAAGNPATKSARPIKPNLQFP
jgi:hypothetical protein